MIIYDRFEEVEKDLIREQLIDMMAKENRHCICILMK